MSGMNGDFIGHDDYGTAAKVIEAFANPQGFYLAVTEKNDNAAPVVTIEQQPNGLFMMALQVSGRLVIVENVPGDKAVHEIDQRRWILYLASNM